MLDGMQSFWNSVEAVDVVTRVFPMCCIRLSLLNIHQAIQPITTDNPAASELKYGQHVRAKLQEPFLRQQHHDKFELLTVGLM